MNKPKIIYYGIKDYPSKGGTSRVAENIIKNLKSEFDFVIYCYKNPMARNNIEGIKVVQFPEIGLKGFGVFLYFLICAIHILIFQSRSSVIHAHKTDCALFIPLLKLKFKVIFTSHEAPYKRDKWGVVGKSYLKMMEKMFIFSGAYLTSISKPLSEFYFSRYGKEIIYIPNGIDPDDNRDPEEANRILENNKVRQDYILFAARRLMYSKGIHTFLKAAGMCSNDLDYVYAGEHEHISPQLREEISLYSAPNIKYIGFIDKLPVLLSIVEQSKFFVFPSETEGMSIMLLEVVSTGTPLICSDIPENTAIFNGSEVLFFNNKDEHDLKEKIEWALRYPEEMKIKAKLAFNRVKKDYSWSTIALKYGVIYSQIAK